MGTNEGREVNETVVVVGEVVEIVVGEVVEIVVGFWEREMVVVGLVVGRVDSSIVVVVGVDEGQMVEFRLGAELIVGTELTVGSGVGTNVGSSLDIALGAKESLTVGDNDLVGTFELGIALGVTESTTVVGTNDLLLVGTFEALAEGPVEGDSVAV